MVWLPHSQPSFTAFAPKLVEDMEGRVVHQLSWRHAGCLASTDWPYMNLQSPLHNQSIRPWLIILPSISVPHRNLPLNLFTEVQQLTDLMSHVSSCVILLHRLYINNLISQAWCTSHMYSINDCVATNLICILFRFDMSIFCGVNGALVNLLCLIFILGLKALFTQTHLHRNTL